MANPDSLSPDQMEKLMHFQDITGCTDLLASVQALTATNWNIEQSIDRHLNNMVEPAKSNEDASQDKAKVTSTPGTEVRQRVTTPSNLAELASVPSVSEQSDRTAPRQNLFQRFMNFAAYVGFYLPTNILVYLPFKFFCWSLSSVYNSARAILNSTSSTDPTSDVSNFIEEYEATYPNVAHPPMFPGSYNMALSTAKQNLQFMLVYLHCKDHLNTEPFCRNVLANPVLINYLTDNNILFWACDVARAEGYRVSQALRENNYPFLGLIGLRNNRMSISARMEGETLLDATLLRDKLQRRVNSNMGYIAAARQSRLEREQAVALRQEQDTAYEASLRADREKARKKNQEKEREKEEQKEKERELQREKDRRVRLRESIPEEPPAEGEGILELVIKLPNGERIQRRFLKDQPLYLLYCLIYTREDAPDSFEVTTTFPRKVIPCGPPPEGDSPSDSATTFGDFGIVSKTVLFVKDLDA